MLTIKDLREQRNVIHDRTKQEYEIIDTTLQVKIDDGDWQPAVSYRKVSNESWKEQIFIRNYSAFMKNFSMVPDGQASI